jgi:hypothetical protein
MEIRDTCHPFTARPVDLLSLVAIQHKGVIVKFTGGIFVNGWVRHIASSHGLKEATAWNGGAYN